MFFLLFNELPNGVKKETQRIIKMEPEHYELLASNLKNRVLTPLSDNYNTWCCGMIAKHLQLTPDDCLADIGGGTGLFTELLRTFVDNPKYEWICADPSENMLLVAQS